MLWSWTCCGTHQTTQSYNPMNIIHISLVVAHAVLVVVLFFVDLDKHLKNREPAATLLSGLTTLLSVLFVVSLFILPTGHSTYRNIEAKSTRVGDILVVKTDGIKTITTGELRFVDKELFIRETQPRNAFGMRLEKRVSIHVKSESE